MKIGFGGSLGIPGNTSAVLVSDSGVIRFKGRAELSEGSVVRCDGGALIFGSNFSANKNCGYFTCRGHKIIFGDDCLLGWNVTLRNSDGHSILGPDGAPTNEPADVAIGDHTWIAANVDIFKGSRVPNGCAVAAHALVTKHFTEPNVLLGGMPAKILRRNIDWCR